ncbi:hypothetical protein [Streptomyces sp. NPDC047968]|uniref:hypothetical protein n=1 Tax=unclassified Streptomyces TaxID=2593676 RepID=UPI0034189F3C
MIGTRPGRDADTTTPAVLYVCADRGTLMPHLAAERAEEEGRAFADRHGLMVTEVITDEFGEPDPVRRGGWQRVRELARAGTVTAVLVRWPASIAPEVAHEFRCREATWLRQHGVRVCYTWAPLAKAGGAVR